MEQDAPMATSVPTTSANEELRGSELVQTGGHESSSAGIREICNDWRFRWGSGEEPHSFLTQYYCQHVTGPWRDTNYGSKTSWQELHRAHGDIEGGFVLPYESYISSPPEPDPFSDNYVELGDNQQESQITFDLGTPSKRNLNDKRPERLRARGSLQSLGRRDKGSSSPLLLRVEGEVDTGREDQGKD